MNSLQEMFRNKQILFPSSAIPSGPDTDWNYWFGTVKKGAKTGKDNGFSVLFDIESFDYGYYDEGSEGLKVFLAEFSQNSLL